MLELTELRKVPDLHIPGLRLINPSDDKEIEMIFRKTKNMKWLWEDQMRLSAERVVQSMLYLWGNPANTMINVNEGGAMSVVNIVPGFRGYVYVAAWDRSAMGKKAWPLWRTAAAVAMEANSLQCLEAIIAEPNTLGHRLAKNCGMEYRRTLRNFMCYNGVRLDARHYELNRENLPEFFGDTG